MSDRHQRPRDRERQARRHDELSKQARIENFRQDRAQLRKTLGQTAIATAVIGLIFLLTGDHSLHLPAVFLLAWSGGWALASLVLLIQRRANRGRRPDDR